MALKKFMNLVTGVTGGNKNWINEGVPEIKTLLSANRGVYFSVPSIDGGEANILNYDSTANATLSDTYLNVPITYTGTNYYSLNYIGASVGLELNYIDYIKDIELYFDAPDESTISAITFYVMSSEDGITWTPVQSFTQGDIVSTMFGTYRRYRFSLSEILRSRFVSICSGGVFRYLLNSTYYNCHISELHVFSPEVSFGSEDDTYKDRLTGHNYQKINNIWEKTFSFPEIPQSSIGTSAVPPSAVGKPNGSMYFVI